MEFPPLYGYVEFLDKNGEHVSERGEPAYVVSTSLDNHYFPFIRYQTDDCVHVLSSGNVKKAERIVGRKQEFVLDAFGNKLPFTCNDEVIWDIEGIVAYQYLQREKGKLELRLQTNDCFDESSVEDILKRSEEVFVNCAISIVFVPSRWVPMTS